MSLDGIQVDNRIVLAAGTLGAGNLKSNETENVEVFGRRKKTEFNSEQKIISKHQYKLLLEKEIESIRKSNEENPEPMPEKYIKEMAKENLDKKYAIMNETYANAWYKDKIAELAEQNPEMSKKDVKKAASKAFEEEFGEVLPKDKPLNSMLMPGNSIRPGLAGLPGLFVLNPLSIYSGIKLAGKIKHQNAVHKEYDKKFEEANKPHGVVDIETPTYEVETTDENGNKVVIDMDTETNLPCVVNTYSKDNKLLYQTVFRGSDDGNIKRIDSGWTTVWNENGKQTKLIDFEIDENGNTIITDVDDTVWE